jgi:DNA-binding response OmpR family regulator
MMSGSCDHNDSARAPTKGHILVVEDERQIARFIELELIHEGYQVTLATDGIDALIRARQDPPDLVVLDVMLPGTDGLEVCRRLRSGSGAGHAVPIIMVTAKDSIPDRVMGLKTGADDYLTKPFSIEELLARIEALLRRSGATNPAFGGGEWLQLADLVVNTATREVMRANQPIELTTKEYELLEYLLRHPRQVLSREQIYTAVWGDDFAGESNVLEVYIRYLRNKIDTQGPRLIHTVRGVGYVLKDT